MAIILRRQISDDEKNDIIKKFGRNCFATGHSIPENETIHFDHIKAWSADGQTEINNIAPMCEHHNKQKGTYPLYDFKIKLLIDQFFQTGGNLTLKDELLFLKEKGWIKSFGDPVYIEKTEGNILKLNSQNKIQDYSLYECPITGFRYFYAILPVEAIDSDDDESKEVGLQPRYLIEDKLFTLFRHFQMHPVLQPSICRLKNNKVLVFDGQHKIAALLWNNRTSFECKIYIDADPILLNKTNISAHDQFAQTRFYSTILVSKLGKQFGKEFDHYKNQEDTNPKTEVGFIHYLKVNDHLTNAEANKRFRSFLYDSIIDDEDNKLTRLISKGNRRTAESPITMDMLEKSLFHSFLYRNPVEEDMTSEKYLREDEFKNMIELFNLLDDVALSEWDSNSSKDTPQRRRLERIFGSKSMMAWSELLRDAVCGKLNINDAEDRAMPFYRKFTQEEKQEIKRIVTRLADWTLWDSPKNSLIDQNIDKKRGAVKDFFKENGLTTGYLMGAPE